MTQVEMRKSGAPPAECVDDYPSRGAQAQITPRKDPVVYSEWREGAPISREETESYRKNGYFSFDLDAGGSSLQLLLEEAGRLAANLSSLDAETVITEPGANELRTVFRLHEQSDVFARLLRSPRLVDLARFLLGDDVYIHQSRLNYKPGFHGKEFYWHSDFETWHVEDGMPRMRALSMSIALLENNEFNGPLMVIPGSHMDFVGCIGATPKDHYKSSLKKQEYGVPDPESLNKLISRGGIRAPKGPAGSVTVFDCNTMHGSNGNITPFPRSNVFVVYNAVSNRLVAPFGGMPPRPEFLATRSVEERTIESRRKAV